MEDWGRIFNPRESERKKAVLPPFKQRPDLPEENQSQNTPVFRSQFRSRVEGEIGQVEGMGILKPFTVKGTDETGDTFTKKEVVGDATQTPEAMDID